MAGLAYESFVHLIYTIFKTFIPAEPSIYYETHTVLGRTISFWERVFSCFTGNKDVPPSIVVVEIIKPLPEFKTRQAYIKCC